MEDFLIKPPPAGRLIRWLFMIICLIVSTIIVLIFALSINEVVTVPAGEIISENTPMEYLAPYDAELKEVKVKQGDKVKKGDTLLVLFNPGLVTLYEQSRKDLMLAEENIFIYEKLLENLETKMNFQKKIGNNLSSELNFGTRNNIAELKALETRKEHLETKIIISRERIKKEHALFLDGGLSENEYAIRKKSYLEELNEFTEIEKQLEQKRAEKSNIRTQYDSKRHSQELNVLAIEHEYYNTEKNLQEAKIRQADLKRKIAFEKSEMDKSYIRSDIDGFVTWTYITRQGVKYISKATALAKVVPEREEKFYAKLLIPEEAVKDVRPGQRTNIKLNAYNYYQYGVLKGEVSLVHRDSSNYFALAHLQPTAGGIKLKNGFKVRGEVVIERIRLYRFILRKLFSKIDTF